MRRWDELLEDSAGTLPLQPHSHLVQHKGYCQATAQVLGAGTGGRVGPALQLAGRGKYNKQKSGAGTKEPRPSRRFPVSRTLTRLGGVAVIAPASQLRGVALLTWTDQRGRGLTLPLPNKLRATKRGQNLSHLKYGHHVTRPSHQASPPTRPNLQKEAWPACSFPPAKLPRDGAGAQAESNYLAGLGGPLLPAPGREGGPEPSWRTPVPLAPPRPTGDERPAWFGLGSCSRL